MEIDQPMSWLKWYLSRENAPKISTAAKQALFMSFDASKSEENTKVELLKNNETIIFI